MFRGDQVRDDTGFYAVFTEQRASASQLARAVTTWNKAGGRRFARLISYIQHTKNHVQHCYVWDKPEDCFLGLFCDASFAGDLQDSKSTT